MPEFSADKIISQHARRKGSLHKPTSQQHSTNISPDTELQLMVEITKACKFSQQFTGRKVRKYQMIE